MNLLAFIGIAASLLAILVGMVSIFTGALHYVTSSGDAAILTKSKNTILYGLILIAGGIVLAVLVFVIVAVISSRLSLSIAFSPLLLALIIAITLISATATFAYSRRRSQRIRAINYRARIRELTKESNNATEEVDRLLQEKTSTNKDQEAIIAALVQERKRLLAEIDTMKKALDAEKFPIEYMEKLDKKNAKSQLIGTLLGIASLVIGIASLVITIITLLH